MTLHRCPGGVTSEDGRSKVRLQGIGRRISVSENMCPISRRATTLGVRFGSVARL